MPIPDNADAISEFPPKRRETEKLRNDGAHCNDDRKHLLKEIHTLENQAAKPYLQISITQLTKTGSGMRSGFSTITRRGRNNSTVRCSSKRYAMERQTTTRRFFVLVVIWPRQLKTFGACACVTNRRVIHFLGRSCRTSFSSLLRVLAIALIACTSWGGEGSFEPAAQVQTSRAKSHHSTGNCRRELCSHQSSGRWLRASTFLLDSGGGSTAHYKAAEALKLKKCRERERRGRRDSTLKPLQ